MFIESILCARQCSRHRDEKENKRYSQEAGLEAPKVAFLKGWDAEGVNGKFRVFQNFTLNNLEPYIEVICPSMSFQAF